MPVDRSKFVEKFKSETRERIQALNLGFIRLEKSPQDKNLLKEMMREAHSIKGASTMMGYKRIAEIAHAVEDGLEKALEGTLVFVKAHFDIFFKCLDAMVPLLEDKVSWPDSGVEHPFAEDLCRMVRELFSPSISAQKKPDVPVVQAPASEPPDQPQPQILKSFPEAHSGIEDSIRVDTRKLDSIVNLSGELLISKLRLMEIERSIAVKVESSPEAAEPLGGAIRDLSGITGRIDFLTASIQQEVMKTRMLPVSHLFNLFPRSMRDLAHSSGKDISFEIEGEDPQLDKEILDRLQDPLMHLLRNAIDHGIESMEERKACGKSPTGSIRLCARQEGTQVVIEVSDDGRGIDSEKVKEQAVKKGFLTSEKAEQIVPSQIYQILFAPGFSTRDEVNEVSGRGVGLDVVKETLAGVKGIVEVQSSPGKGASFILRMPLTLAVTESLIVAAGDDLFAIPIEAVIETVRVKAGEIQNVETKEAVSVRGQILPLVRLNDIFGLPRKGIFEKTYIPVIVVQAVEKRIALAVDGLSGRQEIIAKSLGDPLQHVRNIAGGTILGSGKVVLVLDIAAIIDAAEGVVKLKPVSASSVVLEEHLRQKKKKTILLAEDVLSTAMLEKNILESVGYSVVAARDGKDALDKSLQETFDAVITDVLMPRMDGFELIASLRKNNLYKDIPIIVVTTRENDADKRRGMEAGADAYILKSDFTSDTLLDTLERLLG